MGYFSFFKVYLVLVTIEKAFLLVTYFVSLHIGTAPYEGNGCRDIRSFTLTVVVKERTNQSEKLQDFVCQCSTAVKQRNFTHFGLSDGKCFAIGSSEISLLKTSTECTTIFSAKPIPGPESNVITPKEYLAMTQAPGENANGTSDKEPCLYLSHQCDAPSGSIYLYAVESMCHLFEYFYCIVFFSDWQ